MDDDVAGSVAGHVADEDERAGIAALLSSVHYTLELSVGGEAGLLNALAVAYGAGMGEDDLLQTVAVDVDQTVEAAVIGGICADVLAGRTDEPRGGVTVRPVVDVHDQIPG